MLKYIGIFVLFLAGCAEAPESGSSNLSEEDKMRAINVEGCERDWKMLGWSSAEHCVEEHNSMLGL